jgi:hypothetical protein
MLSVRLGESEVRAPLNGSPVSVAALNGPRLSVDGGENPAITHLEQKLRERGVACQRMETSPLSIRG